MHEVTALFKNVTSYLSGEPQEPSTAEVEAMTEGIMGRARTNAVAARTRRPV